MHFLFQPYSPNFSHSYNFDASTSLSVPYTCVFYCFCHVLFQQIYWLHNVIPIDFLQNLPWTLFNSLHASIPIPQFHTWSLNQIPFHIYSTLYYYTGGCCLQEVFDIFLCWLMFSVYSNLVCFPVRLLKIYHLPLYSSHPFSVFKLSLIFLHT
jgi:hypothetical protein